MGKLSLFVSALLLSVVIDDCLPFAAGSYHAETNPSGVRKNSSVKQHSKDAYVTLLYGSFVLGVRVLGLSLRNTGTKKDLVVLCTEGVSESDKTVLRSDGWIILSVKTIESPYKGFSSRGDYFKGIYTKLFIWNMTEYERVVYLDADVLVLANIDHMFDCGTFCAAYRHSDHFNAGIIVVEPSRSVYMDMLEKIPKTTSYDDGDQGFLNVYFKDVAYAPMFNWSDPTRQRRPMRMSGRLNADMGLYYAFSEWDIPEKEVRVIHYTLGPIKPWKWWTLYSGLFHLGWLWQDAKNKLPKYVHHNDAYSWWNLLFWAPFPLLIVLLVSLKLVSNRFQFLCRRSIIKRLTSGVCSRKSIRQILPLTILLLSYYLSFIIVPETMEPRQAEYVFWLWSNFFIFFLSIIAFQFYHFSRASDDRCCSRVSLGRSKSLFAFCFMYFYSYILLKIIPPFVHSFNIRVVTFLFLLAVHLTCAHIAGTRIQKEIMEKASLPDVNGMERKTSYKLSNIVVKFM